MATTLLPPEARLAHVSAGGAPHVRHRRWGPPGRWASSRVAGGGCRPGPADPNLLHPPLCPRLSLQPPQGSLYLLPRGHAVATALGAVCGLGLVALAVLRGDVLLVLRGDVRLNARRRPSISITRTCIARSSVMSPRKVGGDPRRLSATGRRLDGRPDRFSWRTAERAPTPSEPAVKQRSKLVPKTQH